MWALLLKMAPSWAEVEKHLNEAIARTKSQKAVRKACARCAQSQAIRFAQEVKEEAVV